MAPMLVSDPILGYEGDRRVWRFADGTVIPYIAGGDGPAEMPTVPEDLTSLTDEQVGGLEGELLAWFAARRPEARTPEDVAALTACADSIEGLRTEAARRYTAAGSANEAEAALAALDGRLAGEGFAAGGDAGTGEGGDGDAGTPAAGSEGGTTDPPPIATGTIDPALIASIAETVGARVAAAVTAAITPPSTTPPPPGMPNLRSLSRYQRPEQQPLVTPQVGMFPAVVTAATTIPGAGLDVGMTIPDGRTLAEAMASRWNVDRGKADTGAGERITVAHLVASVDDSMRLRRDDEKGNLEKIAAFIEQRSLTAAGGLCAPVTPIYDQPVIATAVRPFRAGFPTFIADRGGVRIVQPPTMADIVGVTPPDPNPTNLGNGVGTITVSQDQAGSPLKSCLDVPCHSSQEYDVEAIYRCLQFANLGARVFPENVEAFNRLTMAVQAQKAETLLLDAVAAVAHQLTFAKTFGTARQLLSQLGHAAAQFRNVNRMDPEAVLQVRMPAWALNAMRADITSSFHDDPELFSAADALLESWFADLNLAVGYFIDSPSGKGQTFAAVGNNGTAFPDFPTTVVTYMWVEGTFMFLDGGTLDVGIVRDSTLVAENRFRDFSESWEGLAWTGLPVYELTHAISNDGSYGAALAITASAGSGL